MIPTEREMLLAQDSPLASRVLCPALNALGLDRTQLASLARQGTLRAEGLDKRTFKLRFRHQGRRVVRYVGIDPDLVARVEAELNELQAELRIGREARRVTRRAREYLREIKSCLTPALAELGFHYHGNEIRRRSTDKQ